MQKAFRTSEVPNLIKAVEDLYTQGEKQYREQLRVQAATDITAFGEYLDDEWFPARHHAFLCEYLEAIYSGEVKRLLLSMPPGHAKPVSVDEIILMGDGSYKRLEDIIVGDYVITHTGSRRKVLAVHEQGLLDVVEINTDLGRKIKLAPDHPVLTPNGFLPAGEITPGTTLASVSAPNTSPTSTRDISEYILAGYLVGDGSTGFYGKQFSCRFTNEDPECLSDFSEAANTMGFGITVLKTQRSKAKDYNLTGAQAWIRDSGLGGMTSHTKRVPEWVYRGTPEQISAFVGAYFACDGTVNKRGNARKDCSAEFVSCQRPLLEDVQRLLLRLGIRSRIANKPVKYQNRVVIAYRLTITSMDDVAKFTDRIRVRGPKSNKLTEWATQRTAFCGNYLVDKVVEVVPAGKARCKCLTVEDDHTFTANDIVVHNSTYASHIFPAYCIGRNPDTKFLQAGHTQDFVESQFGRKVRGIVNSQAFKDVFPGVEISNESKAAGYWQVGGGKGYYLARGVGTGISGFRTNLASVDDPIPSREAAESPAYRDKLYDWFTSDFYTRLLPLSPLLIIATRFHPDDLIGRLEAASNSGNGDHYEVINLPAVAQEDDPLGRDPGEALWPNFFTLERLEELKRNLPPRDWASLYMGTPFVAGGGIVQEDWFMFYDNLPPQEKWRRVFASVDCANTATERSDFTSITVWLETIEKQFYLLEVVNERVEFTPMVRLIDEVARRRKVSAILVEDAGAGKQLIQTQSGRMYAPLIPISVDNKTKTFRFDAVSPLFSSGQVILPRRAPWLSNYIEQLISFPSAKHDDMVDSTSQALSWARPRSRKGVRKLKGVY